MVVVPVHRHTAREKVGNRSWDSCSVYVTLYAGQVRASSSAVGHTHEWQPPLPLSLACAASSHATPPPPFHPRDYDRIISLAAATDSILCRS